jgi:hypothetical protein
MRRLGVAWPGGAAAARAAAASQATASGALSERWRLGPRRGRWRTGPARVVSAGAGAWQLSQDSAQAAARGAGVGGLGWGPRIAARPASGRPRVGPACGGSTVSAWVGA